MYDTDEQAAAARVEKIHEALLEYHRLFDIYHEYEGINNIKTVNDSAGVSPVKVDARLIELVLYAKRMHALTGGKMNIAMGGVLRIWHDYRQDGIENPERAALPPMEELAAAAAHTDLENVVVDEAAGTIYLADPELQLDLGGIAKGYAGRMLVEQMRADGVDSMLLSLGGNVCAIGRRLDGQSWKVSVQSPDMQGALCTVNVDGLSLVTSGSYQRYYTVDGERYHHVIDPDTLMPAQYFDSVSVLCADSALADALSTALMNLPLAEGRALVEGLAGAEALWVDTAGAVSCTDGFKAAMADIEAAA